MAINKKLIHFKTKAAFEAQLAGSNILGTSIVFIQDANLIWTHGTYYGKSEIYIGTNEPTNGEIIWINPDTDEMKYFDGTQWVTVVGKALPKETLIINLESNQTNPDSYLNGAIVNVRYSDVDHKQTWAGDTLIFKIPDGVEYTIEYSDIINPGGKKIYTAPKTETYTAEGDKFRTLSRYYKCCKLTIKRTNNQNATMGIGSATITYLNYSQTANFTRAKNSDTITIPYNVKYTITFNETMTDYRTPANITGTSNSAAITKTGSYDSEKLTVKVTGVSSGFTITVNGKTQTYTSRTYYIPYGTTYTISASSIKGYVTTISESSITASEQTRTVTVTYATITNGVYICDNTGNLTTVESWNTSDNSSAIGVAVISDNCSFVIEKTTSYSSLLWGGGYGNTISGVVKTSTQSTAQSDYSGESNTTKIINQLGSGNAPAADYCRGRSCTVNGTTLHGYLGAAGEWWTAYNNKSAIDSALSKIGGTAMYVGTNYHWTSTQYNSDNVWILGWGKGIINGYDKNSGNYVRAFYPLPK